MRPPPIPEPSPPPCLPVLGAPRPFPVRRILCIGRNYAAHAREMGADDREPPFYFTKSADALCVTGAPAARWPLPPRSQEVHHEVEHVVALGAGGRDLSLTQASQAVCAEGVGLDMTRRDVQADAKKLGRPWATAKDFDGSAVVGPLQLPAPEGAVVVGPITLEIDGAIVQRGDLADRIWSVPELIAELSRWITLRPGDLLFTGTPAGVGPVRAGQRLVGRVEGLPDLCLNVVDRP